MFCCWAFCFSFCITLKRLLSTYHSSMSVWRGFCISTLKRNHFQVTFSLSAGRIVPVCIQNVRLWLLAMINLHVWFRLLQAVCLLADIHFRCSWICLHPFMLKIPVGSYEPLFQATFTKCCTLCSWGRHNTALGFWRGVNLEQWDWFSFLPLHRGKASSQSCLRDSPLPQSVLPCCLGCPKWL